MAAIQSIPFPVTEFWTTQQVAEYTGIAVRTLEDWRSDRNMRRRDLIPFVRLNAKKVVYRPQDVVAWIERHVIGRID